MLTSTGALAGTPPDSDDTKALSESPPLPPLLVTAKLNGEPPPNADALADELPLLPVLDLSSSLGRM